MVLTNALLFMAACNDSKLDRVITAIDIAAALPQALQLAPDETERLTAGFGAVAAALRQFREHPSAKTWRTALAILADLHQRNVFRVADPVKQARITAIITVVERFANSITPHPTAAVEAPLTVDDFPDARHLDDADIRELERLVKPQ